MRGQAGGQPGQVVGRILRGKLVEGVHKKDERFIDFGQRQALAKCLGQVAVIGGEGAFVGAVSARDLAAHISSKARPLEECGVAPMKR